MPLIPVRDLSKHGVITDVDPYDLPSQAFNFAQNVRFVDGRIKHGPVWRNALTLANADPRYVTSYTPTSGLDNIIIGYKTGRLGKIAAGVESNVSIAAYADNSAETPFTSAVVANVIYVNRSDRVPWALTPAGSVFVTAIGTINNWDSTHRAGLIRGCGGAVVALNITKGATNYPTMVKWSEFCTANAVSTNWDPAYSGTNAGENTLADMRDPIVDAQQLRDSLMIYSQNETWQMQATGNTGTFQFTKIFNDAGSLNANCAVEASGVHYVFGPNDIWVHDGTSKSSIATGRVRSFVYANLNASKANRCFVTHNLMLKEIVFHFVSGDAYTKFASNLNGCNRAAVYNYVSKTWTFYDTPLVFAAVMANLDSTFTWTSVGSTTWDTVGGTWLDQEDTFKRVMTYVGESSAADGLSTSLYACDLYGSESLVAFSVDTNATKGAFLYKDGIDLDELGADLPGYKNILSVYPQARIDNGTTLSFQFGSADYFGDSPTYSSWMTYDGDSLYKLDFKQAGRYLSMNIKFDDYRGFTMTGYDVLIEITGER